MRHARVLLVALAAAFAMAPPVLAQWPSGCVELNDIVEAHLGNHGNVGIYQRVFSASAEVACQSDHRDDSRAVFAWAFDGASAGSIAPTPWPSTCVALNDIVEAHLDNQGNVGIYQRSFDAASVAEAACQRDHRADVRLLFGWAFDSVPPNRWLAISSGAFHTCALRLDGLPVCWGAQRGDGGGATRTMGFGQAEPPEGERLTAISSGRYHTCGLRADGSPVCWGIEHGEMSGSTRQVGFGQTSPPTGERFTAISSGGFHTCGLRADGRAVCWGNNDSGQSSPHPYERLTSISTGYMHSCGLRDDGTAVCWGPEPYASPYGGWQKTPGGRFLAIDSTRGLTCGIRESGRVECWGGWSDVVGQIERPPRETLTALGLGDSHACGIRPDGTMKCWGYNEFGELSSPWGETFTSVTAGVRHSCALRRDRTAVCWGDNGLGQAAVPGQPELISPGERFRSVSSGYEHVCGLLRRGEVVCWRHLGEGWSSPLPGERLVSISSGGSHVCGLRKDGAAVCIKDHELDHGQASPPPGQHFTSLSSGEVHTCGLRTNGTVVCWGGAADGVSGGDLSLPRRPLRNPGAVARKTLTPTLSHRERGQEPPHLRGRRALCKGLPGEREQERPLLRGRRALCRGLSRGETFE